MQIPHAPTIANRLLAGLALSELESLRPHLVRVQIVRDQVLIEAGQPASHVFFVETGIVTLRARSDGAKPGVQVAMIGPEGLVGGLALLDDTSAPHAAAVVLMPGGALRVPVRELRQCVATSAAIQQAMMRYVQSLMRQVMETAAHNASRTLAARCTHWLLMAHDRMDGDDLAITHDVLADLLCVRRSGVTVAMASLQENGLIRTSRGRIRVLDRAGLLAVAAGIPPRPDRPPRRANGFHAPQAGGFEPLATAFEPLAVEPTALLARKEYS